MPGAIVCRLYYFRTAADAPFAAKWVKQVIERSLPNACYLVDGYFAYCHHDVCELASADPDQQSQELIGFIAKIDRVFEQKIDDLALLTGVSFAKFAPAAEAFALLFSYDTMACIEAFQTKTRIKNPPLNPLNAAATDIAIQRLLERPEASRLFSEALSGRTASAQLVGFVRLFEAAFAMKHNPLKNRLHSFLQTGFTEIPKTSSDAWIQFRHFVAHARTEANTLFSGDVFQQLFWCRIAALDVAVNKEHWRTNSFERYKVNAMALIPRFSGGMYGTGKKGYRPIFDYQSWYNFERFPRSSFGDQHGFELGINARRIASDYNYERTSGGDVFICDLHGINSLWELSNKRSFAPEFAGFDLSIPAYVTGAAKNSVDAMKTEKQA